MSREAEYKTTVIALVPSLKYLDYVQVSPSDITAAEELTVMVLSSFSLTFSSHWHTFFCVRIISHRGTSRRISVTVMLQFQSLFVVIGVLCLRAVQASFESIRETDAERQRAEEERHRLDVSCVLYLIDVALAEHAWNGWNFTMC
jgi:hypothetical protein